MMVLSMLVCVFVLLTDCVTCEICESDKRLEMLERETLELRRETVELRREKVELKREMVDLRTVVAKMDAKLSEMAGENLVNVKTMDKGNIHNSVVAFTAFATETRDYNATDVISFDGIISNYGSHFDNNTSTFTCPYTGLYLFMITARNDAPKGIYAQLYMDGTRLASAACLDAAEGIRRQCSNSVLVICEAGSTVKVTNNEDECAMIGNSNIHSTFSGLLVRVL